MFSTMSVNRETISSAKDNLIRGGGHGDIAGNQTMLTVEVE
jgi:hypothetical protein